MGKGSKTTAAGTVKPTLRKGKPKCKHGRETYYCKECGGKGICQHGRRRKT
jgi:hypothetical protein